MAFTSTSLFNIIFILTLISVLNVSNSKKHGGGDPPKSQNDNDTLPQPDLDFLDFPLNMEYLETEFFLFSALGYGLDKYAPELALGGPSPRGGRKAFLDPFTHGIIYQFALQEVGHLRAIKKVAKGYPRPLIDLSSSNFAHVMNLAFERPLYPQFDPYVNSINYLLAAYLLPYICLNGATGANIVTQTPRARHLVAALLAVEAGQDGIIRTLLYQRRFQIVYPYGVTVQEFTNKISSLRNRWGKQGIKDEGLFVNPMQGAEGKTPLNILAGDPFSVAYARTSEELLRIMYTTGNESRPGGFLPQGGVGRIARRYLDY